MGVEPLLTLLIGAGLAVTIPAGAGGDGGREAAGGGPVIRSGDLDPAVLEELLSQIRASYARPDASEAERLVQSKALLRFIPNFRAAAPWVAGGFGAMLAGGVLSLASPWFGALGLLGFWALVTAGGVRSFRSQREMIDRVHPDLLAGWLPHLELSRAERAYCQTIVRLARPELEVDERTVREVLAELNRLIDHYRRLDAQRQVLEEAERELAPEELERERRDLSARREQARDAAARDALEQSLALCEERLRSREGLRASLERVTAQQEVIVQTLVSLQAQFARLEAARQALSLPEVDDIRHRLRSLEVEADAVEAATAEVLHLRRP